MKLQIYRPVQETQEQTIFIANSTFNSGIDGWTNFASQWTWDAATSACTTTIASGVGSNQIFTPLLTQMEPSSVYTVEIEFTYIAEGFAYVNIGNTRILTATTAGTYTATYVAPDEGPMPQFIAVTAMAPFDGAFKNVYIYRDKSLSPNSNDTHWEPYEFLDMDGTDVALNYQVGDLTTLSGKFGYHTKQFTLPGTKHNREVLQHLYKDEHSPTLIDPRNRTRCQLIGENEGNVLIDGWLIINNVVRLGERVQFECEIYNETFNFIERLKGKRLRDLDLSELDHYLTYDNISSTWNTGRTWTDGYIYPFYLVDDGIYDVGKHFWPAIYDRYIFEKVLQETEVPYNISDTVKDWMGDMVTTHSGQVPKVDEGFASSLFISATTNSLHSFTTNGGTVTNIDAVRSGENAGYGNPTLYYSTRLLWNVESNDVHNAFSTSGPFSIFRPVSSGRYRINGRVSGTFTVNLMGFNQSGYHPDMAPASFNYPAYFKAIGRCTLSQGTSSLAASMGMGTPPERSSPPLETSLGKLPWIWTKPLSSSKVKRSSSFWRWRTEVYSPPLVVCSS